MPRLALSDFAFLKSIGVRSFIHRRRIMLKAMDAVLYGPPRKKHSFYKDVIVIFACVLAVAAVGYALFVKRKLTKQMSILDARMKENSEIHLENERHNSGTPTSSTPSVDGALDDSIMENELKSLKIKELENEISELKDCLSKKTQNIERTKESRHSSLKELQRNKDLMNILAICKEAEDKLLKREQEKALNMHNKVKQDLERMQKKKNTLFGAVQLIHGEGLESLDQEISTAKLYIGQVSKMKQASNQRWRKVSNIMSANKELSNSNLLKANDKLDRGDTKSLPKTASKKDLLVLGASKEKASSSRRSTSHSRPKSSPSKKIRSSRLVEEPAAAASEEANSDYFASSTLPKSLREASAKSSSTTEKRSASTKVSKTRDRDKTSSKDIDRTDLEKRRSTGKVAKLVKNLSNTSTKDLKALENKINENVPKIAVMQDLDNKSDKLKPQTIIVQKPVSKELEKEIKVDKLVAEQQKQQFPKIPQSLSDANLIKNVGRNSYLQSTEIKNLQKSGENIKPEDQGITFSIGNSNSGTQGQNLQNSVPSSNLAQGSNSVISAQDSRKISSASQKSNNFSAPYTPNSILKNSSNFQNSNLQLLSQNQEHSKSSSSLSKYKSMGKKVSNLGKFFSKRKKKKESQKNSDGVSVVASESNVSLNDSVIFAGEKTDVCKIF